MNIAIIGSMKFAEDMVKIQKQLDEMGHAATTPIGTETNLSDQTLNDNLDNSLEYCITHDIMRKNFQRVAGSDAVLVLNYKKNDIEGYIGISGLMEMGMAHYLKKKIFLMQHTPNFKDAHWAHEVAMMQPKVIKGDLAKIV